MAQRFLPDFSSAIWSSLRVHYAVHRWTIGPNSWLYSTKLRHLTHHRLENCNFGVTTIFWDIIFRTNAKIIGERKLC